jgi:putative NIF3 family GTP cyclohydrolase 1 type 2
MMSGMRFRVMSVFLFLVSMPMVAQDMTAADALAKVRQRYPAALPAGTVDTVKAGDPATKVTGIATTFLDTLDVLREASRHGLNLVITHEPTFYNHLDATTLFANDPVYKEKLAFIEEHHMVVFRLHDAIHMVPPDTIAMGLIDRLAWRPYLRKADDPFFLTIPPVTLGALAKELQRKLGAGTMRVVGDPSLVVTKVGMRPGAAGLAKQVSMLERDDVEVLIAGEASEWETVEYARDATAEGRKKALILLGHEPSEEDGMEQCARDLRAVFPGVKVEHIVAGNAMWTPEHPVVVRKP